VKYVLKNSEVGKVILLLLSCLTRFYTKWRIQRTETYEAGKQKDSGKHHQNDPECSGDDVSEIECCYNYGDDRSDEPVSISHVLIHNDTSL